MHKARNYNIWQRNVFKSALEVSQRKKTYVHRCPSVPFTHLFVLTQHKWDYFKTPILRDRTSSLTSGYDAQRDVWEDMDRCHRTHVLTGVTQWAPTVHAANTSSRVKYSQVQGRRGFLEKGSSTTPGSKAKTKHQPLPKNSSKSRTLKSSQIKQMTGPEF